MDYSISIPFWNQKTLIPPHIAPIKLPFNSRNAATLRTISSLRTHLSEMLSKQENLNLLNKEAAVLSRLVYRMKRVFRQYKGFKYMQMLLKTLRNHLPLEVSEVVKTLRDSCYASVAPSRQMVEWGLVTLMRFAALFNRASRMAELTAAVLRERLTSGHHWKLATLCIGVVSRIWALSNFLVTNTCGGFDTLATYLPIVASSGENWLPAEWELPADLSAWLGTPSVPNAPASVAESKTVAVEEQVAAPRSLVLGLNEDDLGEAVPNETDALEKGPKRKESFRDKFSPKKRRKKT